MHSYEPTSKAALERYWRFMTWKRRPSRWPNAAPRAPGMAAPTERG